MDYNTERAFKKVINSRHDSKYGDYILILLIIGFAVFIIKDAFKYVARMHDKKVCTYQVRAVVTDIDMKFKVRTTSDGVATATDYYRAVFSYTYNDKEYEVTGKWTTYSSYRKNREEVIYIDPDNPEKFYSDTFEDDLSIGIQMIVAGSLLVGSVGLLIYRKKRDSI